MNIYKVLPDLSNERRLDRPEGAAHGRELERIGLEAAARV